MTGPLVPVGMLNLIRAVLGIRHHRFNLSVKRSNIAHMIAAIQTGRAMTDVSLLHRPRSIACFISRRMDEARLGPKPSSVPLRYPIGSIVRTNYRAAPGDDGSASDCRTAPRPRHVVFCFAKAEDADAFCKQFDGERLAPARRPFR